MRTFKNAFLDGTSSPELLSHWRHGGHTGQNVHNERHDWMLSFVGAMFLTALSLTVLYFVYRIEGWPVITAAISLFVFFLSGFMFLSHLGSRSRLFLRDCEALDKIIPQPGLRQNPHTAAEKQLVYLAQLVLGNEELRPQDRSTRYRERFAETFETLKLFGLTRGDNWDPYFEMANDPSNAGLSTTPK